MCGRGRVWDNIFIERLWRSVKWEEVYLNDYETVPEAVERLGAYFHHSGCQVGSELDDGSTRAELLFEPHQEVALMLSLKISAGILQRDRRMSVTLISR